VRFFRNGNLRRGNLRQYALLLLRITVGFIFVFHGLSKLEVIGEGGFGRAVGTFSEVNLPAPEITAPILTTVETLGGLALIFGVMAQGMAILLAVVVSLEILLVKLPQTLNPVGQGGYIFELALLAGLVALGLLGLGALALDE
jgi:putative oxidoreductase